MGISDIPHTRIGDGNNFFLSLAPSFRAVTRASFPSFSPPRKRGGEKESVIYQYPGLKAGLMRGRISSGAKDILQPN